MAISSIRQGYSGQVAGGEVAKKTSVRRFSMATDDPADGPRFTWPQNDPIDTSIIIPAPGTLYPGWGDIRSKEPQIKKISPTFFNVEVHYGTNVSEEGEEGEDDFAANPLSKPAEERWGSSVMLYPVDSDMDGLPYENIFGQPVIGKEREFRDEILYLTRNEAAFNELNAHFWLNTIYDGTFRNIAKGRVLMKEIGIEHIKDKVIDSPTFGEILYSKVSYEIHFRHRTVPLINAYYVKALPNNYWGFESIANNEANQSTYAWYSRRVHTATGVYDDNNKWVPRADGKEFKIDANTGQVLGSQVVPDFIFQRENDLASWPGVA